jgi:hypothetical protein
MGTVLIRIYSLILTKFGPFGLIYGEGGRKIRRTNQARVQLWRNFSRPDYKMISLCRKIFKLLIRIGAQSE